ncbi:transketolase [Tenuifilum sp.]|uniref:transketolase n=1 Tax=Tenuifilum sp. TaxID=2760880 RepID=UPI001B47D595|nr:transketolase [Bacteroidales bacterium]HOK61296.1 transketolase [Tenuifilum sp.]HOK85810.1 transketolase [Tenuifilum sp.]HON70853.1 transketolase [Tenuifilum sp.]HOU74588.1 transketolase [Tenuifilum sp.]
MADIDFLKKMAAQVRRDVIRMVHKPASGHPGGSLGCADFFTALYFEVMNIDPKNFTMDGTGEDVFFLSNGHLSAAWYSVLARRGFFEVAELSTFRLINSRLQGHPTTAEHLPGIRVASGSLGQGLSVACGAALAKKLNGDKNLVYTLHGDGELQEGQIWEAALFAAAKKIDNLIATVDYNGKQIDGPVDEVVTLGNLKAKWESFGWEVLESNGNDMEKLISTFALAKSKTGQGKPIVILMRTEMGMGVDFMMGTHKWHGKAPNDEEFARAMAQLPETIGDF